MKIIRLVYEWPPPWDGLAPGIYELSRSQVKLGHQVTIFCGGNFDKLGSVNDETTDLEGLSVFRFPRAFKRFSLFLTTSPAVLGGYLFRKLRGRGPDLVHGHGHITCCFNVYRFLFGWLDKTPYVLHLHITAAGREAQADKNRLDFWTKYFEWPLHKFSDWLGVRVADRVICVSSRVMEEAIKFYGAKFENLVVVENGVNTARFTTGGKALSDTRYPISGPGNELRVTHNILYVGVLSPRKNVHLLIEAMGFLPDNYHLTIVGRGNKDYENRLHRLVESLELKDRVKFEGYVEYPKLPSFYQKATVFVFPSGYEGLPKVVLEALASGVPVLASGFGLAHLIDGLEFLKDFEPEAIAGRIQRFLDSGVSVDVTRLREIYAWEKKAKEVNEIYDSVI